MFETLVTGFVGAAKNMWLIFIAIVLMAYANVVLKLGACATQVSVAYRRPIVACFKVLHRRSGFGGGWR